MITLVTGAPGHGKSFRVVKLIDESVHAGIPVATNVPLREDWPEVMAKRHVAFWPLRRKAVERKAAQYRRLVHFSKDLDELLRVRFAGKGEGRGRVILDEAHRWLNTRAWDQAPGLDRQEAIAQRLAVVGYVSAHRHYGADVWLVTQDAKNLDSQVRTLYEFHSVTRNMRRLPLVGALIRANLFLVVTRWNDRAETKAGVDMYFLSRSLARLYDTHALQEDDWPDNAIVLPREIAPPGDGAGQHATPEASRPEAGTVQAERSEDGPPRPTFAPPPEARATRRRYSAVVLADGDIPLPDVVSNGVAEPEARP